MTIEQAIKQVMNHAQYKLNGEDLTALNVIIDKVEDRPTGHWILQSDYNDKLYGWFYCSECGAYIGEQTNYCSECGAKML